jgi:hypothetical protein
MKINSNFLLLFILKPLKIRIQWIFNWNWNKSSLENILRLLNKKDILKIRVIFKINLLIK